MFVLIFGYKNQKKRKNLFSINWTTNHYYIHRVYISQEYLRHTLYALRSTLTTQTTYIHNTDNTSNTQQTTTLVMLSTYNISISPYIQARPSIYKGCTTIYKAIAYIYSAQKRTYSGAGGTPTHLDSIIYNKHHPIEPWIFGYIRERGSCLLIECLYNSVNRVQCKQQIVKS